MRATLIRPPHIGDVAEVPGLKRVGPLRCQVRIEREGAQRHGGHGCRRQDKGGRHGWRYGIGRQERTVEL